MRPVAYLSGPITPHEYGPSERWNNIMRARDYAIELWKVGFSVICPHLNTMFMDGQLEYGEFLDGDFAQILRSDLVIRMPGAQRSSGTAAEIEFAQRNNIPIQYTREAATHDWSVEASLQWDKWQIRQKGIR